MGSVSFVYVGSSDSNKILAAFPYDLKSKQGASNLEGDEKRSFLDMLPIPIQVICLQAVYLNAGDRCRSSLSQIHSIFVFNFIKTFIYVIKIRITTF